MTPSDSTIRVGDFLRHHSVPGIYEVESVMHDGRVVVIDPRGERQRLQPGYVRDNFKTPALNRTDLGGTSDAPSVQDQLRREQKP